MNLFTEILFYFPSYLLPIICFNKTNFIALHLLCPVSYPLRSEFCFRSFALVFLGIFEGHMEGHVCVCMHACMSLDSIPIIRIIPQSHGFASGELAKNET